jgi:hypothetical protein
MNIFFKFKNIMLLRLKQVASCISLSFVGLKVADWLCKGIVYTRKEMPIELLWRSVKLGLLMFGILLIIRALKIF